jgi:hypothetical protein
MAGECAISDGGNIECPHFSGHFLGVWGETALIPTQRTKLKPIADRAKAQSAMEISSHLKHGEDSGRTPPPRNTRDRQGLTVDTHIHRRQQSTRGSARGEGKAVPWEAAMWLAETREAGDKRRSWRADPCISRRVRRSRADSVRAERLNWKDMMIEANKKGGANLKKGSRRQEESPCLQWRFKSDQQLRKLDCKKQRTVQKVSLQGWLLGVYASVKRYLLLPCISWRTAHAASGASLA